MALRETIQTIKRFADDTNFLASVITDSSLFYSDGYFHDEALIKIASYRRTNPQELINAIFDGVDDTHKLQLVFDVWKQQLNTIALPNYDDAHFYKKFGGLQYFEDADDIRDDLLSVCGDLKNQIGYFMQDYQLTDNNPKMGFLCPLFYEDDKLTTGEKTSQQGAVREPVALKPKPLDGRKPKPFTDCLLEPDKQQHLIHLHELFDGRKIGKDAALIIKASMELGWITKPTFSQVQNEFGNVGNKSGYNKYMSLPNAFTQQDLEGMKAALQSLCK